MDMIYTCLFQFQDSSAGGGGGLGFNIDYGSNYVRVCTIKSYSKFFFFAEVKLLEATNINTCFNVKKKNPFVKLQT